MIPVIPVPVLRQYMSPICLHGVPPRNVCHGLSRRNLAPLRSPAALPHL
jgi:hypothetical protein